MGCELGSQTVLSLLVKSLCCRMHVLSKKKHSYIFFNTVSNYLNTFLPWRKTKLPRVPCVDCLSITKLGLPVQRQKVAVLLLYKWLFFSYKSEPHGLVFRKSVWIMKRLLQQRQNDISSCMPNHMTFHQCPSFSNQAFLFSFVVPHINHTVCQMCLKQAFYHWTTLSFPEQILIIWYFVHI